VRNIELHIERLVVHGVPLSGGGRDLLRVAMEAELSRLLSRGGVAAPLQAAGALHGITASAIQLDGMQSPSALGRQIAGAVHRGIGR
jgi:hypothetical protein